MKNNRDSILSTACNLLISLKKKRLMKIKKTALLFSTYTLFAYPAFAQVEINELERYIDVNTLVLNEPCIESGGKQFKGQFLLDQSNGLKLNLLSGEELTETRKGCTQAVAGSTGNEIRYDISNLVVADGNMDTGQRFDIQSTGDATQLQQGFNITSATISAPTLVYASSLELPLNVYNESLSAGLEVCLSAIGANTITISNANDSLDLSVREETTTGIKKFCGTIAQGNLRFGDVSYSARINDSIEIPSAVAYWNPQCIDENDTSLCRFVPTVQSITFGGSTFNYTLRLADGSSGARAFLSNQSEFGTTNTEMQLDGDRFRVATAVPISASVFRSYVVSPTGKRSLILGQHTLN